MTQASRSHVLAAISIPRRTSSAVWASSSGCNLVSDAGSHGVIRLGHAGLPGIHLGAAACKIASGSGQLIGRGGREPAHLRGAAALGEPHGAAFGQPRLPAHRARAGHRSGGVRRGRRGSSGETPRPTCSGSLTERTSTAVQPGSDAGSLSSARPSPAWWLHELDCDVIGAGDVGR